MTLPRTFLGPITLFLLVGTPALGQSTQENVFDADEGGSGTYLFETPGNWSEEGPPWTDNEVDGGISFDLDDGGEYTIDIAESYTAIDTINILSRSVIHLNGTGGAGQSLAFNEDGRIETGDGALEISGLDLHLAGDMTFDYGNGDDDDPAETINKTYGTQELAFNLIINGAITDDGESAINGMLTFTGGGYALLTGGIEATGTGSSFGLELKNGASLMLAGGAAVSYLLSDGVTIGFDGGSVESREKGHGILQVADDATLDTTDPDGGGNIDLSGWGALLVGSITLNDEVADLGFEENVATDANGGDVITENMTLGDDSVVIVGDGGTITSTTTDEGVLTMNGSSTFLIQDGGLVDFNELLLNNGDFINQGDATFNDDSLIAGGTFTSSGTTNFNGKLAMNGTFEVLGGTTTVLKGAQFSNGSNLTVNNGTFTIATDTGSLTTGLDGSVRVENGGVFSIGATTTVDADIDVIQIGETARIVVDGVGSDFSTFGHTTIDGELFVQNGGSYTYTDDATNPDDQVLAFGENSIIGGGNESDGDNSTIDLLDYDGGTSGIIDIGTLFGGMVNSDTGEFEAGRGTLTILTAFDLDLRDNGGMIFALGYDADTDTAYNTLIDIDGGGQVRVNDGTSVSLSISGDDYIPTNTLWVLFNPEDINGSWDDVELTGYNTVTRTFTHGDNAGEVLVGTDYIAPLDGTGATALDRQRAAWMQRRSEGGQLLTLLHLFDQVPTVGKYLSAIQAMGATSMTSALQVTADTRTFSVFREALLEMRTTDELGRPGPGRRPLGLESNSMLAAQDEGEAVRSQYGYGSSPESGARRSEGDNMIAFVQGYGRSLSLDNKGDVTGISGNEWGVLTGIGGQLTGRTVLGVLIGYDSFSGDLNNDFGNLDVNTVKVGPFIGWSDGTWNVDFALTAGYNDWRGTRRNPALGTDYDWKTDGYEIDFSGGVGYRIPIGGGFALIPEGSIVYSYIHSNSYQETGGPGVLTVNTDNLNNIIGRAGLRAQLQTIPGLSIEGRLGWQGNYTFGGTVNADIGAFSLPGASDQVSRNNLYYGVQVTYLPRWDIALTLRYEARTADGTDDQYFGGGASFEF